MNIENETIKSLVAVDSPLKQMLVDYVGKCYTKDDDDEFDI